MNLLWLGRGHGQSRVLTFSRRLACILAAGVVVFLTALFYLGFTLGQYFHGHELNRLDQAIVQKWQAQLQRYEDQLDRTRLESQGNIEALTKQMGLMEARLLRVDALGARLTEEAKLDKGEFDFDRLPPLGGPISSDSASLSTGDLESQLAELDQKLSDRHQQLDVLFSVLGGQQFEEELFIAGRPVKKGWMSSSYGYRNDPFTGKRAWHAGVDFAGKEGGEIIAVASGVVTFAGERSGYGLMVEINHGGGYATRYAHCQRIDAKLGDVVTKGEVIARLGSTGRSTGPHVHLEVLKNAKTQNPEKYVWRR